MKHRKTTPHTSRARSLACLLSCALSMTSGLAFADPVRALEVHEVGGEGGGGGAPDPAPMAEVLEGGGAPQLPLGCSGETIPWYQIYELDFPVESCHYATPDGAVPWVGTTGRTDLFYNVSAARIGYRDYIVVACGSDEDDVTVITVGYSQFYSTNDAHCLVIDSGLGGDTAYVDGYKGALTSLSPLIGD